MLPNLLHGSKPPFFWVHGDASSGFLSNYLSPDQPLHALDQQSQDGQSARYTTVEAMAGHHLDQVRGVQAAGPYFLGGFSFGGTIAFEMAQQLRREGETVGLLVLLDAPFPGGRPDDCAASETGRGFGVRVIRHLRSPALLQPRAWFAYVRMRLSGRLHTLATNVTFKMVHCKMRVRTCPRIPGWLLSEYLWVLHQKALHAYKPDFYSGKVIYIKSERRLPHDRRCWAGVIGGDLECLDVPGGHLDIVTQPYAHVWAEKLKDWLGSTRPSTVLSPRSGYKS